MSRGEQMRRGQVAVIGAGLSGLAAARALLRAGREPILLEARDRVGGRLLSQRMGRATFDLGGQWIGPTQRRMHALVEELGAATFETFDEGKKILETEGGAGRYSGTIPRLDPLSLIELEITLRRVEAMRERVSLERPASSPRAREQDRLTLGAWMDRNMRSPTAKGAIRTAVRVIFGAEPEEIPFLYFLFYAQGGGGLMPLVEIRDGAQQTRFTEGAGRFAERLAEGLEGRVAFKKAVIEVEQSAEGVQLLCADQSRVEASAAIFAMPPALLRRVRFSPALPLAKARLLAGTPTGATTKHFFLYERPFWRDEGLSGEVASTVGPASVVFDNSSEGGEQAALLAFVVAQPARALAALPERARRQAVLEQLVRLYGPRARAYTEHHEKEWAADPWARGCPVGVPGTGLWTEHGDALRAPIGRLAFAGTETATVWHGFMEGAVEAGERAAREVLRYV